MENLSVYQMFQEFTLKSLRKFRKISLQIPQNILIRKSCWQLELSGSIVATKYYYPVVLGYGTGTGPDANDSPLHTPNAVMVVQNITSCSLMVLLWWCICWVVCTICIYQYHGLQTPNDSINQTGPCAIAEDNGVIVFYCNVAWTEPDSSGRQQDFLTRIFWGICKSFFRFSLEFKVNSRNIW